MVLRVGWHYKLSLIKPVPKQEHRSSLGIDKEILETCMDAGINGIPITELTRKTGTSNKSARQNCSRLVEAGLLNSIRTERNYIFVINENGIRFVQEIQRFYDAVQALNLRY